MKRFRFGSIDNEAKLENLNDEISPEFESGLLKLTEHFIKMHYQAQKKSKREEEKELSYQVYFKNAKNIKGLIDGIPKNILNKCSKYFV